MHATHTLTSPATPTPSMPVHPVAAHQVAPRRAALVAGGGYVGLFVLAILANFLVLERLVVADDPMATLANIAASPGQFRLGIAAFLVIAVIDVVVAWALHVLLREVSPDRSLLSAWFRVLHSVFLGVGLAFLSQVDHLVAAAGGATGATAESTAAQVMTALDTFDTMWMVGLAFFGLHLIAVATLLVGRHTAPRVLRVVLVAAGVAYIVDTIAFTTLADYDSVAAVMLAIVALPSVLGEGWFGLWLFTRGGRQAGASAA